MEGTATEIADATRDLFDMRMRGIFDASGTTINQVITVPAGPEPSCPQSVQDAFNTATMFKTDYEYCLAYATWLDNRVSEKCAENKNSVASEVQTV